MGDHYKPECCQCACYLKEKEIQLDEPIIIWSCPNKECLNNHEWIAFVDDRLVECNQCSVMDSRV